MMRNILFWLIAMLLTVASAVFQRLTGPTYPISGEAAVAGHKFGFELGRSHGGPGDQILALDAPDSAVTAELVWRRYKTGDPWTRQVMERAGDRLIGRLPHQPPAGKLEYHLVVHAGQEFVALPEDENAVTRFKGDVPAAVLIPHIALMFSAMLLSARTGLDALRPSPRLNRYLYWTVGLIFAGGMIFGPIVQKYAFGALWTGFPLGTDLTDNKTLIAFLVWVCALAAAWRKPPARAWILTASIVTLVIFAIPHSMHGSELDYSTMEQVSPGPSTAGE